MEITKGTSQLAKPGAAQLRFDVRFGALTARYPAPKLFQRVPVINLVEGVQTNFAVIAQIIEVDRVFLLGMFKEELRAEPPKSRTNDLCSHFQHMRMDAVLQALEHLLGSDLYYVAEARDNYHGNLGLCS